MTADLAAEYGLKVVAASTGTREADICSPDPAVVKRGEDLLAAQYRARQGDGLDRARRPDSPQ